MDGLRNLFGNDQTEQAKIFLKQRGTVISPTDFVNSLTNWPAYDYLYFNLGELLYAGSVLILTLYKSNPIIFSFDFLFGTDLITFLSTEPIQIFGEIFSYIYLNKQGFTILPWNNIISPIEGIIFPRGKIADFLLPTVPCFFEAKSGWNSMDAYKTLNTAFKQISSGLPAYNKGGISILISDERCLYVQWINI